MPDQKTDADTGTASNNPTQEPEPNPTQDAGSNDPCAAYHDRSDLPEGLQALFAQIEEKFLRAPLSTSSTSRRQGSLPDLACPLARVIREEGGVDVGKHLGLARME